MGSLPIPMTAPEQPRSSPALMPASLAQHTVESLYAEHGPQRPWIYWLVLAGLIGALAGLPLVIRFGDLERRSRNRSLPARSVDRIGDSHPLTIEPVVVAAKPPGDTVEQDELAGPLSDPAPLHGGSVVKILPTTTLRQEPAESPTQGEFHR